MKKLVHAGAALAMATANRTLALVSKAMNLAEKLGWRPDKTNPCRHVDKYKEHGRERFLSEAEFARLAQAMVKAADAQAELDELHERKAAAKTEAEKKALREAIMAKNKEAVTPIALAAIRTLTFTGARLREILNLKWSEVDLGAGIARLEDSKTGARIIWLLGSVCVLRANLPRLKDSEFVFPFLTTGRPMPDLKKPWAKITKAAGLDGLRLHDLRHSHASVGVAGGMSLQLVGALLGHREIGTTKKYAHIADAPQRQAAEAIASRIEEAMNRKDDDAGAEIVDLNQRRAGG